MEEYGDPAVDALIPEAREWVVANMMDGDDGGFISSDMSELADEIALLMAQFHVKHS